MFKIPDGDLIFWDCETTGLAWRHGDRPYCFGFSNLKGESAVISFPVNPLTREVTYDARIEILKKFFANPKIKKGAHNAQFDYGMTQAAGIPIQGEIICTMSLIRLLRSSVPLKLKPFCKEHLGIPDDDETVLRAETMKQRRIAEKKGWKIFKSNKKSGEEVIEPDYWLAGQKFYEPYCRRDAERAALVYLHFYPGIAALNLEKLWETELETWTVLRDIENRGVRVFPEKILGSKFAIKKKLQMYKMVANTMLKSILPLKITKTKKVKGQWKEVVKEITKVKEVNFRSPDQLQTLFYSNLQLSIKFLTNKGNPSTDSAALKGMQHPLAKTILNMRSCVKTIEFMDQYLHAMVKEGDQWFIHPTFYQSKASTGRESCAAPNLQQVASGEVDKGIEVRVEARSVFGARKGYVLRSYDWKNIEVYIPGYKSQDPQITAVLDAGGDVHENTSKSLTTQTHQPISRFYAKRSFFGLQYGIGPKKLAKDLGISENVADLIVFGFKSTYPDLWKWMDTLKRTARRDGKIITAYGRPIEVLSGEEYKAINYYVQGTAGSILKSAKIKVHHELKNKKLDAHIVLPIHDELVLEISKKVSVEEVDEIVIRCMQDNPELNIPIKIPVSVSAIGRNWSEKEKVKVV